MEHECARLKARSRLTAILAGGLALLGLIVARAAGPLEYPPAARGPVIEDYHGVRVADPYRWLEELDSTQTRAWVEAEAKLTDGYLQSLPHRERLRARIGALYDYERFGIPFRAGGRYFYTSNTGHEDQSVLYTMRTLGERPAVALDPNTLTPGGIVTGYVPSRDGRLLAYGVSVGGSDWTEWRVRDLSTHADLPDVLRFTKYYPPAFTHDGRGLYYSAFPEPRAGAELSTQDLDDAVWYHALGTPATTDRRVLYESAHRDWQYAPHATPDGRWLVVTAGEGEVGDKGREDVYLIDLNAAQPSVVPVARGFEAAFDYVGADDGRVYLLTTLDAPNGRVIGIDPQHPARDNWRSVIAQGTDAIDLTDRSVTLVGHQLIVRSLHSAHSRVAIYDLNGQPRREIELPGPGTATGFEGLPEDGETFYSFTDLITPPTIYRYDLQTGRSTLWRAPWVAFRPAQFEERQVFYPSKDGTRIPMLLAYRKGLKLDGNNPLLLYGYGGFGIPNLPTFNPARIAWLEMGGVYASANIRGGGEFGEAWHRQAIRTHKQVVFDDFIAAAEWLIAQHYTSSPKLAIYGRSNGGLLVGACLTQRPDLYGAAVPQVGVLDMLRFDKFGQGAGWEGDYGSPDDPADFHALYAYSPVHNVHPGTRYPATLIITGDHDTRVMPMHSFKFAAALQAAQAGTAPVLLEVERDSGHGGAETVTHAIALNADIYAFLAQNLGLKAQ
ncbi:MAG: prolyl oligopeptidase family serine peptidase [Steroidobacteraceae bacterium]